MRTERVPVGALAGPPGRWVGGVLCRDVVGRDGRTVLPKGHRLERADDVLLDGAAPAPLHLLFLDAEDVDEETAARRLAAVVAGPGVVTGRPVESQITCRAATRGLVDLDAELLGRLNAEPDVTVFTLPDGMPVDQGRAVAGVKVTPLAVGAAALDRAVAVVRDAGGPVLAVRPFSPLRIAVLVCEALPPPRRERFEQAVTAKVRWFGGTLGDIRYLPDREAVDPEAIRAAAASADLLLIAGVASTDPLDAPWEAVMGAGARVVRRGLPVHPGSSYWIVELAGRPVVGVASCGMFSRQTALDLLLARYFTGQPLDPHYLGGLGHGGLLAREMAFRFPPYPDPPTDEEIP
ncbi:MAG TPA: hypothetical protein VMW49_08335 [Candidatus Dormibacteraeota bacterium]|nr:hypothetical protein [Candidatus Dormibacteraeota bacterium]